jgi:hypothetical protein
LHGVDPEFLWAGPPKIVDQAAPRPVNGIAFNACSPRMD